MEIPIDSDNPPLVKGGHKRLGHVKVAFIPDCPLGRSPSINSVGQRPTNDIPQNLKPCKGDIRTSLMSPLQGFDDFSSSEGRCPSLLIEGLRPNGQSGFILLALVLLAFVAGTITCLMVAAARERRIAEMYDPSNRVRMYVDLVNPLVMPPTNEAMGNDTKKSPDDNEVQ